MSMALQKTMSSTRASFHKSNFYTNYFILINC